MGSIVNVSRFGCESRRKLLPERLHLHPRFHAGLAGFLGCHGQRSIIRLSHFILPNRLLTGIWTVSIDGGQLYEHATSAGLDFKARLDWMRAGLVCHGYNSDNGRPKFGG